MGDTRREFYQVGFKDGYEAGELSTLQKIIEEIKNLKDPRNKYTEHRRWNAALDKVLEVIEEKYIK